MQECLNFLGEAFPQRKKVEDSFVPKSLLLTAKEQKQKSLQGSLGPEVKEIPAASVNSDNYVFEYPFLNNEKTSDTFDANCSKDKKRFSDLKPRVAKVFTQDQHINPETISGKKLKQLYLEQSKEFLPSYMLSQFLSCNESNSSDDGVSIQKQFNNQLSKYRTSQRNFSDIFCTSAENPTLTPVSAISNRNFRVVHKEIFPSNSRTDLLRTEYRNNDNHHNDSIKYIVAYDTEVTEDSTHNEAKFTSTSSDSAISTTNNILGSPFTDRSPPRVQVAMYHLEGIPLFLTEENILSAIRKCHCFLCKLWLPLNILTGEHKGVCSMVIRASWTQENFVLPIEQLDTWLESHDIKIVSKELLFSDLGSK